MRQQKTHFNSNNKKDQQLPCCQLVVATSTFPLAINRHTRLIAHVAATSWQVNKHTGWQASWLASCSDFVGYLLVACFAARFCCLPIWPSRYNCNNRITLRPHGARNDKDDASNRERKRLRAQSKSIAGSERATLGVLAACWLWLLRSQLPQRVG